MALPSNPWRALKSHLPTPLQNRYYLSLVIFFFVLIFLDRHSLWTQFKLSQAVHKLENDRTFYEQKIQDVKEEAADFDATKEKYAREHYFMKKRDEDVYIIKTNE